MNVSHLPQFISLSSPSVSFCKLSLGRGSQTLKDLAYPLAVPQILLATELWAYSSKQFLTTPSLPPTPIFPRKKTKHRKEWEILMEAQDT